MLRRIGLLALLTVPLSCSSSNTNSDAGDAAAPWVYQRPATQPGDLLLETPEFDVAAGAEVEMCTYTTMRADTEIATREIHSYQGPGGHHTVLFYTTVTQEPGVHPCTEREMTNWRFIGGGQESQESALNLPPRIAIRVPAGTQLVIQSHYLNTRNTPIRVRDALLVRPADRAQIDNYVDSYNIYDDGLEIPPRSPYGRTLECTAEADMHIVSVLGHTHGYGTRARISLINNSGMEREIYNELGGDRLQFSPPTYAFPENGGILIRAGERIRLSCDWMNTTDQTLYPPQEMCASLMYYWPGRGAIVCGNVIETRGGFDGGAPRDASTDAPIGNTGCTTPAQPGDPCVRPCHRGNELGVGRYCTAGGGECTGARAFICTADVGEANPAMCTRPCTTDSQCGTGAVCTGDSRGRGCVPVECVSTPSDGGTTSDAAMSSDAGGMDASLRD